MCTNLVWLIFHRHDLILGKERKKINKKKDILTWKQSTKRHNLNLVEHVQLSIFSKLVNG